MEPSAAGVCIWLDVKQRTGSIGYAWATRQDEKKKTPRLRGLTLTNSRACRRRYKIRVVPFSLSHKMPSGKSI